MNGFSMIDTKAMGEEADKLDKYRQKIIASCGTLEILARKVSEIWYGAGAYACTTDFGTVRRSLRNDSEDIDLFSDYIRERIGKYDAGDATAKKIAADIEQAVWADVDTGMA